MQRNVNLPKKFVTKIKETHSSELHRVMHCLQCELINLYTNYYLVLNNFLLLLVKIFFTSSRTSAYRRVFVNWWNNFPISLAWNSEFIIRDYIQIYIWILNESQFYNRFYLNYDVLTDIVCNVESYKKCRNP